jgi:hypothetical protein
MGNGIDPTDRSRSQIDISVAGILTRLGYTQDEVVWVLMEVLEHGAARARGGDKGLRLAQRAAVAAEYSKETQAKDLVDRAITAPKTDDGADIDEAMKSLLGGRA